MSTSVRSSFVTISPIAYVVAIAIMIAIVVASNVLVQFPINPWLTYGALTYPIAFLVSDLLNRRYGPAMARKVALVGFVAALAISFYVASPRIALASGFAYLSSQLLDIQVFDRLRAASWWKAPLIAGILAATLDTFIFFLVAFYGHAEVSWFKLFMGDLGVKLALNLVMLAPFRAFMWNLAKPASDL